MLRFALDNNFPAPLLRVGNAFHCSCQNAEFVCGKHALGCDAPDVVKCPTSLVDGAVCSSLGNGECERIDAGKRYACACDKPGPKWRCAAADS